MKTVLAIICLGLGLVAAAKITPAWLAASQTSVPLTEVQLWQSRVTAAGGTLESDSLSIATTLSDQLAAASYSAKIRYVMPLLGSNLAAALVPLRDMIGAGSPTNVNFVDANFSQATGIQGDGSTKLVTFSFSIAAIGSGENGGLGWWEKGYTGSGNVEPIGAENNVPDYRFSIDLRSSLRLIRWGMPANAGGDSTAASNGHWYGQRSSNVSRKLYKDGAQVGSENTASDSSTTTATFTAWGVRYGSTNLPYPGRCAVLYFTDGTMTDAEVAAFHTLLQTYLITPTGR